MDDGTPTLEVGFAIETSGSFEELMRLQEAMGSTEAKVVAEAARIEQATGGMVKVGGATAQVTAFGNAATREMREVARETARAERSGEAMVRQLTRQVETFGKTASEIRQMRAELRAVEAENRGLTELAGRLRAASAQMDILEASSGKMGATSARSRHTMMQFGMQMNDVATMAALGAPPMQIFASQIGQIVQVAQGAEGGVKGFSAQLGGLIVRFAPFAIAIGVAAGALALFQRSMSAGVDTQAMIDGLGLTKDEIEKLENTTATFGDTMTATFQVIAQRIGIDMDAIRGFFSDALDFMTTAGRVALAGIYSSFVGTFRAISAIVQGVFSGKSIDEIMTDVGNSYTGAFEQANNAMLKFGRDVQAQISSNKLADLRKQAAEIKEDRTPKTKKISDEQRAYEAAVKAADNYIAAVQKEAAQLGKTAKEIRLMEDAVQRLNAPLQKQKQLIDEAAAAREAAYSRQSAEDFRTNVMRPLQDELALYGLVGAERAAAALELEKESFLLAHKDDGLEVAMQRWREYHALKSELIGKDAAAEREEEALKRMNEQLGYLIFSLNDAGDAFARAFGPAGGALADMTAALVRHADQQRELNKLVKDGAISQAEAARRSGRMQVATFGDMTAAAKGFFKEGSGGYKALEAAEKAFRAVQFALSVRAMAQDMAETASTLVNSGIRTAKLAVEAVVKAISSLPFPLNLVAGAATAGAIATLGVAIAGSFGGGGNVAPSNTGTGTVLGDSSAQSESIKRAIDQLKEVDTVMLSYSRQMAASLRSIEGQIGGLASLVVRSGNINADSNVAQGFKPNLIGSVLGAIPIIGGFLGSLFGSRTDVIGSGLYGGPQSLGSVLGSGFDASYYSDVQKTKKFLGIVTGRSQSTQFSEADAGLEAQFTLLLRQFNDAIVAAAGPLGAATSDIQNRLNSFVVNLGKIDLKDLTGQEIEEKLNAVFGAAADDMAKAAFPYIAEFQKVGEGAFETLVRVASTVEAVSSSLDLLGASAQGMGLAAKVGLAEQFDSISDLTGAAQAYFETYYSREEQAAARTAQMAGVFRSLGMAMPATLSGFRALVEAQDLTTEAGRETYATLLKLAPAFADLKTAMDGAKSAADILAERQGLQRQLLELRGDTAALRALELAKLDESNRALQVQIWAIQDAQEAARAADELRKAWQSVGDSIKAEVDRIRGLNTASSDGGFASILGRFNAANQAARGGDMDAAKSLPGLSQALLNAAAQTATSRQELARIQAQTAASLEATNAAIAKLGVIAEPSDASLLASGGDAQANGQPGTDAEKSELRRALEDLRAELAGLRAENNAGHAATAGNTGKIARTLDNVTAASGGDAIATVGVAA
ncbi:MULTISPECIES: phage tail length tape measure family protein [unclassified Sphingobium]|uniref:phage tail length tape measure family protein n=1 Tax=unclassified Sphingobium TaxID=2611147 RepID=UPI0022246DF7|nr:MULTISPECIES: phage tail length tape measure family protein [unclassified Sphingobium]MCW2395893.1 hypothetical protein [Sphingobium sp. B8D3B]MCW2419409.1 hypothetical protein [Sphingobium sp. B8D3C]